MINKIKVGIIGGAGYTAGELIRILLNHPYVELVFVHSSSNAGKKLYEIHSGIFGETEIVFSESYDLEAIDALFLCSAHGASKKFWEENTLNDHLKVIDLAQDFRDESEGYVYGLPEMNLERIKSAKKIANPGCFATAIQLALLPLANKGLLNGEITINAITGSTGAGVKPGATTHFSWRNNNLSVYKAFEHQHLKEINRNLILEKSQLNFVPMRGDFSRGIFASITLKMDKSIEEIVSIYNDYYKDAAFTFVYPYNLDLKQVVNTNKCLIALEKHEDNLLITSVIDNLLKGASGQAVQNMNLIFGLDEKTGLNLKSMAF